MTTTVIVKACCADTKEVYVGINENGAEIESETSILQDGEEVQRVVFDNRVLFVSERLKAE